MLAHLYHLHHQTYQEDIPFWLSLAAESGGPLFELGCGTGRVLLHLARAGYPVVGVDRDPDMLTILRAQAVEGVELIQADFTEIALDRAFPLAIMPCNTYSTLDKGARLKTLDMLGTHLEEGGCFAFSIPNPARLAGLDEEVEAQVEEVFEHPASGNPVQVSSAWQREGQQVRVVWHYDHLKPDGSVERSTRQVSHSLSAVEEYRQELAEKRFSVQFYGDFERNSCNSDSQYVVCIAKIG